MNSNTDRKLRILHTEASVGWGGQEIRVLTEAQVFRAHGHQVIVAANEGSEIAKNAARYDVPLSILPLDKRSVAGVRAVRRVMTEWRPDVVVPHSSIDSWLVAIARVGLAPRPRVVRTRHISAAVPRNFASRWVYNRGADFVVTTGEAIVDALSTDGFMPRARLAAVPTGIDADNFKPGDRAAARDALGLPRDKFLVGNVATLRSWKGHSILLEAVKLAGDARLHAVIVGDGPQDENIEKQRAALGIVGQVTLTGRQTDVTSYMRAFDLFVLPSYANEGVPQALLQAAASGLPIISCPIGGISEIARELESVTLVPPKDAPALAAAMLRAMQMQSDPAMLERARARILSGHSREEMYRQMMRYFLG